MSKIVCLECGEAWTIDDLEETYYQAYRTENGEAVEHCPLCTVNCGIDELLSYDHELIEEIF